MHEAILKSRTRAMTIIKRSEERQFEAPSLIICPEPGFKPSIPKKYNLSVPTRYVFTRVNESIIVQNKKTIQGVQKKKEINKNLVSI